MCRSGGVGGDLDHLPGGTRHGATHATDQVIQHTAERARVILLNGWSVTWVDSPAPGAEKGHGAMHDGMMAVL